MIRARFLAAILRPRTRMADGPSGLISAEAVADRHRLPLEVVHGVLRGARFANDFPGGRDELAVALAPIALGAVTPELREYAPDRGDDGPAFWAAFALGAERFVLRRDDEMFELLEAEMAHA